MAIIDQELQKISLEKQNTIKQLEAKEITEEQFKLKICELENLEKKRQTDIMAQKPEETPKTEEIVNIPKPKKRGRPKGYKLASNPNKEKTPLKRKREYMLTEYIIKALEQKSVKDIEQAISKIQEWLPDKHLKRENLGPQIRVFISAIVHKKIKKYKNYTWDAENYLLTKKE